MGGPAIGEVCIPSEARRYMRVLAADETEARKVVPSVLLSPGPDEIRVANDNNAGMGWDATITAVDYRVGRKADELEDRGRSATDLRFGRPPPRPSTSPHVPSSQHHFNVSFATGASWSRQTRSHNGYPFLHTSTCCIVSRSCSKRDVPRFPFVRWQLWCHRQALHSQFSASF
jgi:hypothetical protein